MAGMCLEMLCRRYFSVKDMFLQSPLTKLIVTGFAVFLMQDALVQKHSEVEMMCECFNKRFV